MFLLLASRMLGVSWDPVALARATRKVDPNIQGLFPHRVSRQNAEAIPESPTQCLKGP